MRPTALLVIGALVGIGGMRGAELSGATSPRPNVAAADAAATVTVDPMPTNVAPGTVLTIEGHGFEPAGPLTVRWCHSGASWCLPAVVFAADAAGSFSQTAVARRALAPGVGSDCAQPGACRIEVGVPGSYPAVSVHSTFPVTVDPDAPIATPTAGLATSTALAIDQRIGATGSGWVGGAEISVEICGGDPAVCGASRELATDIHGQPSGTVRALRSPGAGSGVDCAVVATGCWFRFRDDLIGAVVDVPFELAAVDWPRVSGDDVRVVEGDRGTRFVSAEIRLDRPAAHRIEVTWFRRRATLEPTDGGTWGSVVFEPGQVRRALHFSVFGDETDEADEFVELDLRSDQAIIDRPRVRFVVEDDDELPRAYLHDVSEAEGQVDDRRCVVVELTNPSGSVVRVRFVTFGGTATPGADYVRIPQSSTSAYIYPGGTSAEMCIEVVGDRRRERDDTVVLVGWAPQNAALVDPVATLTLENDD